LLKREEARPFLGAKAKSKGKKTKKEAIPNNLRDSYAREVTSLCGKLFRFSYADFGMCKYVPQRLF
jgi:hypothetical protein